MHILACKECEFLTIFEWSIQWRSAMDNLCTVTITKCIKQPTFEVLTILSVYVIYWLMIILFVFCNVLCELDQIMGIERKATDRHNHGRTFLAIPLFYDADY